MAEGWKSWKQNDDTNDRNLNKDETKDENAHKVKF